MKKTLREAYQAACNAYLKAFCEKYGYDYAPEDSWLELGLSAELGDDILSFYDILFAVDNDLTPSTVREWIYHCDKCYNVHVVPPKLEAFSKGIKRDEAHLEELAKLQENVRRAELELQKAIEEYDFEKIG